MVVGRAQALAINSLLSHRDVRYRSFITTSFQSLQYFLDLVFQDAFLLLLNLAILQGENEI